MSAFGSVSAAQATSVAPITAPPGAGVKGVPVLSSQPPSVTILAAGAGVLIAGVSLAVLAALLFRPIPRKPPPHP